jgi:hypothetical protein
VKHYVRAGLHGDEYNFFMEKREKEHKFVKEIQGSLILILSLFNYQSFFLDGIRSIPRS